jgi:hypothetical protein
VTRDTRGPVTVGTPALDVRAEDDASTRYLREPLEGERIGGGEQGGREEGDAEGPNGQDGEGIVRRRDARDEAHEADQADQADQENQVERADLSNHGNGARKELSPVFLSPIRRQGGGSLRLRR